jgi:hypothetical protein
MSHRHFGYTGLNRKCRWVACWKAIATAQPAVIREGPFTIALATISDGYADPVPFVAERLRNLRVLAGRLRWAGVWRVPNPTRAASTYRSRSAGVISAITNQLIALSIRR